MEFEGGGRGKTKRVPNGKGPEGRTYYITVPKMPELKRGEIPPEPEAPPPPTVPAQRAHIPLKDVDRDSDWTDH